MAPGVTLERHQVAFVVGERLVSRGLARRVEFDEETCPGARSVIVIKKAGRAELARPVAEAPAGGAPRPAPLAEVPVFLHARDGLTAKKSSAAAGEPEVIDPGTLDTFWREQALRQQAASRERRQEGRRLRDRARS